MQDVVHSIILSRFHVKNNNIREKNSSNFLLQRSEELLFTSLRQEIRAILFSNFMSYDWHM